MKTTQRKDAVRNIRKRLVSYLSVCLVIMLGLGGTFITRYMSASIVAKANSYYTDHNFKNYELICSLGITDDDIAQIKATEGVTDAEGVIRGNGTLTKGDINLKVELISMTERISVPEVVEGKAPAAADECMIGEDVAAVKDLKVGDKVMLTMAEKSKKNETAADADDEESDKAAAGNKENPLLKTEFTITGLMKHPDYFRRKAVDTVVLPGSAYNMDYLGGLYSHAFVRTEDPKGVDILSNKYFKKTADTKQRLDDLTKTLEVDSLARTKADLYATLDERWQEALDELEKGQDEIDENEANLNDELAKARKDLEDAQKELDAKVADANKQIADGEKKIAASEKAIKAGEKKIKKGEKDIKDAKEKLRLIDKNLPAAKKYLKELREQYEGDLDSALQTLATVQGILDKLKGLDPESEEYKNTVAELADFVKKNKETIRKIHASFSKDSVMEAAEKLKEITDIDATATVTAIKNFDVEVLISLAESGGNFDEFIKKTQALVDSIKESLEELDEYEGYIEEYEKNRSSLYKMVADKEKELEAGKRELAAAKKELAAAKKKLAAAKSQLAAEKQKYQAEIRDGWNLYYGQKADYEKRLEEAKALLAENREEAEKEFAELRADVEKIECKWLVLDRRANAGFVDVKATSGSVGSASLIFGILFMLISAIVCYSTLSIIIEEQKKMVGTVKAFGFLKKEILSKYLVFGVSAAVIGCIAGLALALGGTGIALKLYSKSEMYQFGIPNTVVTPGITIGACAIIIAVCAISTVIACSDILKSPASILMKGGTIKKSGYRKNQTKSKRDGSLYSRLIIRNMRDDKVRVVISIIIIAFSTFLIGVGITMKLAFQGMPAKQLSDVYKYDLRVGLGDQFEEADRGKVEAVLSDAGTEYTLASYSTHVFKLGDRLDAITVITGNKSQLGEFFAVKDSHTGEDIELPEDGVLTQLKMKESYGMGEGSTIDIYNLGLDECNADVKGVFDNHVGRVVITSVEGYKNVFGEDPPGNCYYVKLNGANLEKLESDLGAVNEDISFDEATSFVKKFEAVTMIYDLIVIVITGIAILMSFMILSNLANICLNRKKTELTVMRINGFSIKQTKGYLARESVITTAAGVAIGVLAGAIATPFIIKLMEQPDIQFVRSFNVYAWAIAVALEVLFSIIINSFVFRKVKDLNFRDVQ